MSNVNRFPYAALLSSVFPELTGVAGECNDFLFCFLTHISPGLKTNLKMRISSALLNELWVITAGHCVEDLLVSQIRLRMGEYDFSSVQEPYPFVERGVTKKIVHPKYNFFTYEYDLALVRLEEAVVFQPNIAPICLPASDETLVGENGTVTGWGRLSEGGTLPSVLQQVIKGEFIFLLLLIVFAAVFVDDLTTFVGHSSYCKQRKM